MGWVLSRRPLTNDDRMEIATGLKAGWSKAEIARHLGRHPSVIGREIRRNSTKTRGYRVGWAEDLARKRRSRPKCRKVAADPVLRARVLADLAASRTPRQIAGRLRLEAAQSTLEPVTGSVPAQGRTVSHEAIYQYLYALPKGELARQGIFLRKGRDKRRKRPAGGQGAAIAGMVSIDDRPAEVGDRRVPGHWEGDLIIGAHGASAAVTLVERTSRFVTILALPVRDADHVAEAIITNANALPAMMCKSLTWDQGTEMARHAAVTLATDMPVYFAHPRSPWERGTNENTNGLIREYLPKGTEITTHQPYLTAIAEELNNRPRASLGYYTPKEVFERLLVASIP